MTQSKIALKVTTVLAKVFLFWTLTISSFYPRLVALVSPSVFSNASGGIKNHEGAGSYSSSFLSISSISSVYGKSQYKDGVGKGIGGHDLPQLRDNPRR